MQQNEITHELSDDKSDINVAIDNSKITSLLNAVNSAKFKDSEISLNKEEGNLEFESVEAPDEPPVDFVDSES